MGRAGFSLIELLVAMVLLVAISGLAFSSFSSSAKIVQAPNNTAVNVARSVNESLFESVRADQWSPVTGYASGHPLSTTPAQPAAISLNSVTYTPTYTVESVDVDGDGQEDYRRVKTNVSW